MKKITMFKHAANNTFLIMFYILVFVALCFGGYLFYLSFYDFYIDGDKAVIEENNTKNIPIITERVFEIEKGDYIYSIEDEDIATVDEEGNVTGLKEGETTLIVKYKNSLFPKTYRIEIVKELDEIEETKE